MTFHRAVFVIWSMGIALLVFAPRLKAASPTTSPSLALTDSLGLQCPDGMSRLSNGSRIRNYTNPPRCCNVSNFAATDCCTLYAGGSCWEPSSCEVDGSIRTDQGCQKPSCGNGKIFDVEKKACVEQTPSGRSCESYQHVRGEECVNNFCPAGSILRVDNTCWDDKGRVSNQAGKEPLTKNDCDAIIPAERSRLLANQCLAGSYAIVAPYVPSNEEPDTKPDTLKCEFSEGSYKVFGGVIPTCRRCDGDNSLVAGCVARTDDKPACDEKMARERRICEELGNAYKGTCERR